MTVRNALVIITGRIREMPAGDTLNGASGGSASDPSYSPGSFTVATETWRIQGNHIKSTSSQRITLEGTARLRVSN